MLDEQTAGGAWVLAVDDDGDTRALVAAVLARAGLTCRSAESGEAALAVLAEQLPDLLIVDVNMPGLGGLDVCRHAKSLGEFPVLIVSAERGRDDVAAGYAAGADDYLAKPFRPSDLVTRVRRLLDARDADREAEVSR